MNHFALLLEMDRQKNLALHRIASALARMELGPVHVTQSSPRTIVYDKHNTIVATLEISKMLDTGALELLCYVRDDVQGVLDQETA